MKPVYKCDYCDKMGTEEEIREHEEKCTENYDKKSCYTCKNKGKLTIENKLCKYECKAGKDIPAGSIYQFCELYERKESSGNSYKDFSDNFFGSLFGV